MDLNEIRILFVDDDLELCHFFRRLWKKDKRFASVDFVHDGSSALRAFTRNSFDLILLDVCLPEQPNGISILRQVREANAHIGIIMMTGSDSREFVIQSLNAKASAFLEKPFSKEELETTISKIFHESKELAKSRERAQQPNNPSLSSHSGHNKETNSFLKINDLTMNVNTLTVTRNNQEIVLTKLEFELLRIMMNSPGKVFKRSLLINILQSETTWELTSKSITDLIYKLRKKLNPNLEKIHYISYKQGGYAISTIDSTIIRL